MTERRREHLKSLSLPKGLCSNMREQEQKIETIRQQPASPLDTVVGKLSFLHEVLSDFLFFIRKTHPFKRKSIQQYWEDFLKFNISSGSVKCRQKQRVRTRRLPALWSNDRRHSSQGGPLGGLTSSFHFPPSKVTSTVYHFFWVGCSLTKLIKL